VPSVTPKSKPRGSKTTPTISRPWPEGAPRGRFLVGKNVSIFWPADETFFSGRVISYDKFSGIYGVEYDDGDMEAVDLNREEWKFDGPSSTTPAKAPTAASHHTPPSSSAGPSSQTAEADTAKTQPPVSRTDSQTLKASKRPRDVSSVSKPKRKKLVSKAVNSDSESEFEEPGSAPESESESDGEGFVPEQEALAEKGDAVFDDEDGVMFDDVLPAAKPSKKSKPLSSSSSSPPAAAAAVVVGGGGSGGKKKAKSPRASMDVGAMARGAAESMAISSIGGGVPTGCLTIEAPRGGWQVMSASLKEGAGKTPAPASAPPAGEKAAMKATVYRFGEHAHNHMDFLRDRRDASGKRPGDDGFDPTTLWMPASHLKDCTPGQQQWWELKAKNMDAILCFKMGKFYEAYHMDADVIVRELDCIYMKGYEAHAGFPEIAYGRMSEALVQKGYKVARVEQTETPEMLEERKRNTPKGQPKPKCVEREICGIKSRGTRRFHAIDHVVVMGDDGSEAARSAMLAAQQVARSGTPGYLLSVCEEFEGGTLDAENVTVGVALVDTATCEVFIGQFSDDASRSTLRTLMNRLNPAELLLPLGQTADHRVLISDSSLRFLRYDGSACVVSPLVARSWPQGSDLLGRLERTRYFPTLPRVLETAQEQGQLASLSALGALVVHLKRCLLDYEVLRIATFGTYDPTVGLEVPSRFQVQPLSSSKAASAESSSRVLEVARSLEPVGGRLLLDATSLVNLEVVGNSVDGGAKGSLLQAVGRCVSPNGKRLFSHWICAPLLDVPAINDRLDAVEALMPKGALGSQAAEAREFLKKMADLSRIASRIATWGSKEVSAGHPASRAVMYESQVYAKRQVVDLITALEGLQTASSIRSLFHKSLKEEVEHNPVEGEEELVPASLIPAVECSLLQRCVGSGFPYVRHWVEHLASSFDRSDAKKSGKIIPRPGSHPAYDDALAAVAAVKEELEEYLVAQKRLLGCSSLEYWGNGGGASNAGSVNDKRYQIQVPDRVASSPSFPSHYELKSQRKGGKDGGVRRYHTPELSEMLERLSQAEQAVQDALSDSTRAIFERFSQHQHEIEAVARCTAVLDCLIGMAIWSSEGDGSGPMCRPSVVARADGESSFLSIKAGRHPCVTRLLAERDAGVYVPNDVHLGVDRRSSSSSSSSGLRGEHACVLITGPNMGGKSTYLRQAAVGVLLAQLGCYVPAESCALTPADRVFTRVGASDRILAGQSTFFVELTETSTIINCASEDSLVLLDELGRGTSTFDGNAIAWAVTRHLTRNIACRALFATHYHTLTEEFAADPRVMLGHMTCLVQSNGKDPASKDSQVTFLYRFAPGGCPKSYGMNVARLAKLPSAVIQRANKRSAEFEAALTTAILETQGEAAARAASDVGADHKALAAAVQDAVSEAGSVDALSDEQLMGLVARAMKGFSLND
jgi:DNA mismatch repair protein MSH6